jgi:hypothetical protein
MANGRLRQQIASEAARLMYQQQEPLFRARNIAAQRLGGGWLHPKHLPTHREIRAEIKNFVRLHDALDERLLPVERLTDRFEAYHVLLLPLEQVRLSPKRHPEGDALYHSLQVFDLARDELPYDEEFLLAALLHDVGKAIDPQDHVAAGLEALGDYITPRSAWLIENHSLAHALADGSLGLRARRRLEESEHIDELRLLAQCDRAGRRTGVEVPEIEEALGYVRDLSDMCEE